MVIIILFQMKGTVSHPPVTGYELGLGRGLQETIHHILAQALSLEFWNITKKVFLLPLQSHIHILNDIRSLKVGTYYRLHTDPSQPSSFQIPFFDSHPLSHQPFHVAEEASSVTSTLPYSWSLIFLQGSLFSKKRSPQAVALRSQVRTYPAGFTQTEISNAHMVRKVK